MKLKTKIKAGALNANHNEKLVRRKKVAIKSGIRAGALSFNHNEKLVRR
jgi:hypothetical protein